MPHTFIFDEISFDEVVGDPDKESGILSQHFSLRYGDMGGGSKCVFLNCAMEPDESVQDASESDFCDVEFLLSINQLKRLTKMFIRFDEKLSDLNE